MKQKNNKDQFWSFIISEIPNIVQIVGIPSLFGIAIIKNSFFGFVIPILVSYLLSSYLIQRSVIFLKKENKYDNNWRIKLTIVGLFSLFLSFSIILVSFIK